MSDAYHVLTELEALTDPQKATEMARYHKADRRYLGIANPKLDEISKSWRKKLTLEDRLQLASDLWRSDIHEARITAAKLLTQARLRPDDTAAWRLIASWVPEFDSWAIADHAAIAGQKRLVWDPSRIDEIESWTVSPHLWTRRAALVMTLPWTKQNHPSEAEIAVRERVLSWAEIYVSDHEWFIQKAVGWWLRDLSKPDAPRVRDFIDRHGPEMKPFAVREAMRHLT